MDEEIEVTSDEVVKLSNQIGQILNDNGVTPSDAVGVTLLAMGVGYLKQTGLDKAALRELTETVFSNVVAPVANPVPEN